MKTMKKLFNKTIKVSLVLTYFLMTSSLLYLIITFNDNLFNNGTLGIQTLFLCFSITIVMGMVLDVYKNK
jgi:hypothetical protein